MKEMNGIFEEIGVEYLPILFIPFIPVKNVRVSCG
jgi:hypothetical protein